MLFNGKRKYLSLTAAVVALTLAGVAALGAHDTATNTATAAGPSKLDVSQLRSIAHQLADLNAEPNPAASEAVETTRAEADHLVTPGGVSDKHDGARDVFLITVHGHFVGRMARVPPGHELPMGTIMTITVDATTGLITDWGLSDNRPALEQAGSVKALG